MSKALIIGDTHIYPFANHNLFGDKDFRLNQFYDLMYRLVEIGEEYDCEYLFNLGDFTHKPIMNPRTLSAVDKCFKILSKKWGADKHLLISGNHDLDGKSKNLQAQDSSLYVFKQYYEDVDHLPIMIDGKTLAFMSWTPDQDLSWIEQPVDYFFGHLTPYVEGALFGQEIDWDKFKVGFAGDYHQPKTFNGKLHTTNVPIPNYISDCQEGSVIVLDIETGEWERVPTRKKGGFNHLRIYYDDVAIPDEDEYVVRVKRPVPTTKSNHIHGSINLDEVIDNVVKSAKLDKVHNEVIPDVRTGGDVLSLNFLIKFLKVKNFRSIAEFEMVFDNGLYCFTSGNGEGKSSLINSIAYCLNPPRSSKDLIKRGTDEMSVELELEYQGLDHKILRTTTTKGSSVKYWVNAEEVTANNSTELNNRISENLQFMQLWDILYRYQSAPYLLSGYSYSQRIEMVSRLLGLNRVKDIYQVAYSKLKELKKSIDGLTKQLEIDTAVKDSITLDKDFVDTRDKLRAERENLEFEIVKMKEEFTQIQKNNATLNRLDTWVTELEALNSALEKFDLNQLEELEFNLGQGKEYVAGVRGDIEKLQSTISELNSKRYSVEHEIELSQDNLAKLENSDRKCSSCGREFDGLEEFEKHIELEKGKHSDLVRKNQSKIEEYNSEISRLTTDLTSAQKALEESNDALQSLTSEIDRLKLIKAQHDKFSIKQEEFNKFLNENPTIESLQRVNETEYYASIMEKTNRVETLQSEIQFQNRLVSEFERYAELDKKCMTTQAQIDELNQGLTDWENYVKLFHATGDVIKSVFFKVAENLTSNDFVVSTVKTLSSGEERIDFDMKMMVDGGLIDYESLSGGQKVMCDIFFITRLFDMSGNVGLLMLDETLKDLDSNNLELASQMIRSAPINSVLLVTHSESFNNYDYKFNVVKENGCSIYQIEG